MLFVMTLFWFCMLLFFFFSKTELIDTRCATELRTLLLPQSPQWMGSQVLITMLGYELIKSKGQVDNGG